MLNRNSPGSLSCGSARHPWIAIAFWIVLIAAAVGSSCQMNFNDAQDIDGSQSQTAQRLYENIYGEIPPEETVVVQGVAASVDDPQFRAYVGELTSRLRALPETASVTSYYETGNEALVSRDRLALILPVVLKGDIADAEHTVGPMLGVLDDMERDGFKAVSAGDGSISRDWNKTAERDLARGEMVGIPAALIVLLFVFGAAVAAGVPIVLGFLGIVVAFGATAFISRFFNISSVVVNMITMIGLAVGIDYSLFLVERFREERAKGVAKVEAIGRAGDTASRAVLFSGITVIIALSGLFIVPSGLFKGMAIGAIFVVIAAVALALTLLPAVLSLLGDRVNWLHLPGRGSTSDAGRKDGFFDKTTAAVIRHPVIAASATLILLIGAAIPALTINLGSPGMSEMPAQLESGQAFRVLDTKFSAGRIGPAYVLVEGDVRSAAGQDAIARLRDQVESDSDFAGIAKIDYSDDGALAAVHVLVNGDPIGEPARQVVDRLRNAYVPAAFDGTGLEAHVGGASAGTTDYVNTMNSYLPVVIGFVLALSFVLLLMVFRSIVIPVKAIIMNLLSVGAAYGLIVLVFQHGVGAGLLGFHQVDTVAAFLPIFLFAVLFGLSMDYHVFLLSRIQERYGETGDNTGAVAYGLRSTARIITGAAAIMLMVFGGFALGDMVDLQQMGFGLAVAVFLDATIVRSILVPASMELLGDKNWYLPSWLAWLPRIDVEGAAPEQSGSTSNRTFVPEFGLASGGGD
ncbi:MAG: MMPL family transporter [Chloroflexi bacterium]|nr:MMPL family transporter [Chloroflexota bacterium]